MFSTWADTFESLGILFRITYKYLLFSGSLYLFFYVWKHKKFWASKIQQRYPEKAHIFREIKYSVLTILIFGCVILLVTWAGKHGLTNAYEPVDKYGWPFYFFTIGLMIVIHDTYFYWTHRLMHWKPIFKYVHKVHHLSLNPTPFAAYAFHPVEAFIEVGIIPLVAFTIPHHATAITIFALYSLLLNVLGHLGYELFPKGFTTHKLFKWHNTGTHHNMHHRLVKCNYGLYFNFWDRVMKTNHPDYDEVYNAVVEKRQQDKQNPTSTAVPVKQNIAAAELLEH